MVQFSRSISFYDSRWRTMLQRYSLRQIVLWLSGALVGAQAAIISVLVFISELRKRRAAPADFPHQRRQIAEVDGNDVRIYAYGQDLYNAMLAAIDGARH